MSEKIYEMMDWPEIEAVVYSEESEPKKLLMPVRQKWCLQREDRNMKWNCRTRQATMQL